VGDYTRLLAAELANPGLPVTVLTTKRASGPSGHPESVGWTAPVECWDYRSWWQVEACLRTLRPDVLHIQYQTAAYGMHPAINLLPWRLRLGGFHGNIVTTFHDLRPPYLFPKAGVLRHLPALALAAASDAIVLVAREHWHATPLAWLRRIRGDLGAVTHVIPIGSNIPVCPPDNYDRATWRKALGVRAQEWVLVFFGYVNPSKGVDDLLHSVRLLRARGQQVRLVMVGGGDGSNAVDVDARRRCLATVRECGLEESLIWTDYASSDVVSGHLLAGDVCVLPFCDGATFQRGTLLAALAHGLPIVSTLSPNASPREEPTLSTGGPNDPTLVHGENVWLARPSHPEELASAVEALLLDRGLRARLGAGAESLSRLLTWPSIAERHREVYALLAGRLR
jgi:polysaccharide biosynthesis protein PslF